MIKGKFLDIIDQEEQFESHTCLKKTTIDQKIRNVYVSFVVDISEGCNIV